MSNPFQSQAPGGFGTPNPFGAAPMQAPSTGFGTPAPPTTFGTSSSVPNPFGPPAGAPVMDMTPNTFQQQQPPPAFGAQQQPPVPNPFGMVNTMPQSSTPNAFPSQQPPQSGFGTASVPNPFGTAPTPGGGFAAPTTQPSFSSGVPNPFAATSSNAVAPMSFGTSSNVVDSEMLGSNSPLPPSWNSGNAGPFAGFPQAEVEMADTPAPASNLPFGTPVATTSTKSSNRSTWPPPAPSATQSSSTQDDGMSSPVPPGATTDATADQDQLAETAKLAKLKAKIEEKKRRLEEQRKRKEAAASSSQLDPSASPFVPSAEGAGGGAGSSLAERNAVRFASGGSGNQQATRAHLPSDLQNGDGTTTSSGGGGVDYTALRQDKPTEAVDLHNAKSLVGICPYMCPDEELLRRQNEGDLQSLELVQPDGKFHPNGWTLRNTVVKRFRRSAADYKLDVPEWVRPPAVLEAATAYLEEWVMERDRQGPDPRLANNVPSPLDVYQFIWDRTRMIRKDFILQNYVGTGGQCNAAAVRCHERIARWHAMCEHQLSHLTEFVKHQSQQNIQELGQTMKTLNQYYDDTLHRATIEEPDEQGNETLKNSNQEDKIHGCSVQTVQGIDPVDYDESPLVNKEGRDTFIGRRGHSGTAEPEMRGLYILLTIDNDGGMEVLKYAAHLSRSKPEIYKSKPVQLALEIYKAKKEYNYSRFFKILRNPSTPYLFACLMFKYVELMRKIAFQIMAKTFGGKSKDNNEPIYDAYPLSDLVRLLCFESADEAMAACRHFNITVRDMKIRSSSGERIEAIVFWRHSSFQEPRDQDKGTVIPLKPQKMINTIESKLLGVTRLGVCRGLVSGDGATNEGAVRSGNAAASLCTSVKQAPPPDDGEALERKQKEEEARKQKEALAKEQLRRAEEAEKRRKIEEERLRKAAEKREKEERERERKLAEEEARRQEEARRKQEEENRRRQEEERRRQLEENRRRQEEERKRKAELARIEAERRKAEDEHRKKIEMERKLAEQKRAEAARLKAQQEEEARKKRALEAERRRREAEKLEEENRVYEEKRKKREEAIRKEWDERKNEASKKLALVRMLSGLPTRLRLIDDTNSRLKTLGQQSLSPEVMQSVLKSFSTTKSSKRQPPTKSKTTLQSLLRMDTSKAKPASTLLNFIAESQQGNVGRLVGSKRTRLAKCAVVLPTTEESVARNMFAIAKKWAMDAFDSGEVHRASCNGIEVRVIFVDGNETDLQTTDGAFVVIPLVPTQTLQESLDSICQQIRDVRHCSILLLIDEPAQEINELLDEIGTRLAGREIPVFAVANSSLSSESLQESLEMTNTYLLRSIANEEGRLIDRISLDEMCVNCIMEGIWSQKNDKSGDLVAMAAEMVTVLPLAISAVELDAWCQWPAAEFASQTGSRVEKYFADEDLPMNWRESLDKESVERGLFAWSRRFRGTLSDSIDRLLVGAPTLVHEECQALAQKGLHRRAFQGALLWRSQAREPWQEDCTLYFPHGELERVAHKIYNLQKKSLDCISPLVRSVGYRAQSLLVPVLAQDEVRQSHASPKRSRDVAGGRNDPETSIDDYSLVRDTPSKRQKRSSGQLQKVSQEVAESIAFTEELNRLVEGGLYRDRLVGTETSLSRILRTTRQS